MKFYENLNLNHNQILNCENIQLKMQYKTMPIPSEELLGQIVQYIGDSNDEFTFGSFYSCNSINNVLQWKAVFIQAIEIDDVVSEGGQNPVSSGGVYTALSTKVEIEEGKGLSSNDYTTEEKNKLNSLGDTMELKGRVDTESDLPSSSTPGDMYLIGLETDQIFTKVVYTTNGWLNLGDTDINLSEYIKIDSTSEHWILGGEDTGISAKGICPTIKESEENTDISVYKLIIDDGKGNVNVTPNLKGQDNVFVPMHGYFSIGIENGTVYLICEDGATPPPFSLEDGYLYYTLGGEIQYIEKEENWSGELNG